MASTSIVCHIRENVTGERVCPITTGARCTPTHDTSVRGQRELCQQVHLMRLPQQPQRESARFSWDSRSDLCGDPVDLHWIPAPGRFRERPRSHLNEHEVSVCLEIAVVISEDQLLDQWPRRVRFRCGRCSPPQPHPPHLHFRIPSAPHRGRHGFADFLLSYYKN